MVEPHGGEVSREIKEGIGERMKTRKGELAWIKNKAGQHFCSN